VNALAPALPAQQWGLRMSAEQASERLVRAPLPAWLGRREAVLVREAQNGSEDALEELFRRHWRATHRAAYLIVHDSAAAEDIAQESFLAAIRALDRFDRRRPFGPWLHRIVVNRSIDWAR
jgi:RNA polymerase sigma-70 factor (ECF subfamily)